MGKCPFWSSNQHKVLCNEECPFNTVNDKGEICLFKDISENDDDYLSVMDNDTEEDSYDKNVFNVKSYVRNA